MSHYYRTCDICGSNLDPGERCDCEILKEKQAKKDRRRASHLMIYWPPAAERRKSPLRAG